MHSTSDPIYGKGEILTSSPQTHKRFLDKIETVDEPDDIGLPYIDKDDTSDEEQVDAEDKKSIENARINGEGIGYVFVAYPTLS